MKRIVQSVRNLIVFIIAAEVVLRLLGFHPHQPNVYKIDSEPSFALSPHHQLGFALNPGTFSITINDGLTYTCTHTADSQRITSHIGYSDSLPKLHIYGCSLTYGMGVDDRQTYPYLLQQELPSYKVQNYAVPGYGTIQCLLQLQQNIRNGNIPEIVVLNYTMHHDARNCLSPVQRQRWKEAFVTSKGHSSELFRQSSIPKVQLTKDSWQIEQVTMEGIYTHWPGRERFVLVDWVESFANYINDQIFCRKRYTTKIIIKAFQKLCKKHGIRMILAGQTQKKGTAKCLAYFKERGMHTIDISRDLADPAYNLLPYDPHPNAEAHKHYATTLLHYLNKSNLLATKNDRESVQLEY